MKSRFAMFVAGILVLVTVGGIEPAAAQENSSTKPAAIGSRVRSMIELGSVYANIYDIAITVVETVRGPEALERLKAADPGNPAPRAGMEYLLARVKFEMKGRVVNDNLTFSVGKSPLEWVALSEELSEYEPVQVKVPAPPLAGVVKSGGSTEGWVAFAVEAKDPKPVMVFDPDTGGATGRGRPLFFRLY